MTEYYTSTIDLYAKALFDYALASGDLNAIAAQVTKIQALLDQDRSLIEVISAPVYSEDEQKLLLKKIVSAMNLTQDINNFFNILAKNGRLKSLEAILSDFNVILSGHNGYKIVEAIVAQELSEKEQSEIKQQLEKILAAKVQLSFSLNPSIIGGIVIKVDNKMLDASLLSRFTCLEEAIISKVS